MLSWIGKSKNSSNTWKITGPGRDNPDPGPCRDFVLILDPAGMKVVPAGMIFLSLDS